MRAAHWSRNDAPANVRQASQLQRHELCGPICGWMGGMIARAVSRGIDHSPRATIKCTSYVSPRLFHIRYVCVILYRTTPLHVKFEAFDAPSRLPHIGCTTCGAQDFMHHKKVAQHM
eukprot:8376409-Pyramimonas_sp.AAC.1